MTSYRRHRALDAQEQHTRLAVFFPRFRRVARGNPVVWEGPLQPVEGGTTYTIRIEYKRNRRPVVRVVDPPLRRRVEAEDIPHTFSSDTICLHMHAEWTASMYIHETIVPWAALWLFFYEAWHATGRWLGGGHEPAKNEEQQPTESE